MNTIPCLYTSLFRYMQFREEQTTSRTLGFRIEGVGSREKRLSLSKDQSKLISDREGVCEAMRRFLDGRVDVARAVTAKMEVLRSRLEASEWFKSHSVVGSSLLILYDRASDGARDAATGQLFAIDFVHAHSSEQPLSHRQEWTLGNQEDGYLTGLDNLLALMRNVAEEGRQC